MSKESLVNRVHGLLNSYCTMPGELNRQLALLMIKHSKEAILAALIECAAIAYARLLYKSQKEPNK
ncbi:hypothetical protein [Brucella intermedia]|uniref:hypothetical protein n=1 Tax=Brucella intermedia TaxID=94625 RepID=UPI00224B76CD|nr:hypothetical protein [Brucella intermedia]